LIEQLAEATGTDFETGKQDYELFIAAARLAVQESDLYDQLVGLFEKLRGELLLDKIRAVDAWANGETALPLVTKSWESVVDKLYRINIEENSTPGLPPAALTVDEQQSKAQVAATSVWVTPPLAHLYANDLIRTKFVVPFLDGVVSVSDRIVEIADELGLRRYRRYHAKDSGYHARHVYVLLNVPTASGGLAEIAVEIKVLTKLQDTLSELTHLLYEHNRTGSGESRKKREIAWLIDIPDFDASYVGHSAHFIEASIVKLKQAIQLQKEDE
jgi:hypothetical protein